MESYLGCPIRLSRFRVHLSWRLHWNGGTGLNVLRRDLVALGSWTVVDRGGQKLVAHCLRLSVERNRIVAEIPRNRAGKGALPRGRIVDSSNWFWHVKCSNGDSSHRCSRQQFALTKLEGLSKLMFGSTGYSRNPRFSARRRYYKLSKLVLK